MSHRKDHGLEHPALLPSHLDLVPWNKQRRVHESKEEHAGQIQTLRTDSKRQHVVVVRQPPHLAALHSPFRSTERHSRAMDLCQREPTASEADSCSDKKPQAKKADREDRRKHEGVLVNPGLEIHCCPALRRLLPSLQLRPPSFLSGGDLPASCCRNGVLHWSRASYFRCPRCWLRSLSSLRPSNPLRLRHFPPRSCRNYSPRLASVGVIAPAVRLAKN